MKNEIIQHREVWFDRLMPDIRQHFADVKFEVPENIRFSCGWPHKNGCGAKKRTIGQCWDTTASTDGFFQIFISPTLGDPVKAVGVQIHEIAHAVVGLKHGHRKPFADCAKAVGLTPKWTATGESDELKAKIGVWIERIGPYPHGALRASAIDKDKEKGRMLLLECGCGLKIRSTQKWVDQYGQSWPCPCGSVLLLEGSDGDDDGD